MKILITKNNENFKYNLQEFLKVDPTQFQNADIILVNCKSTEFIQNIDMFAKIGQIADLTITYTDKTTFTTQLQEILTFCNKNEVAKLTIKGDDIASINLETLKTLNNNCELMLGYNHFESVEQYIEFIQRAEQLSNKISFSNQISSHFSEVNSSSSYNTIFTLIKDVLNQNEEVTYTFSNGISSTGAFQCFKEAMELAAPDLIGTTEDII